MSKPDPITNSDLPTEIQNLIRLVVKRSRLWKRERESLTLELLAHFQDGLDAGRSAEDLVKTFGDPKTTAKLMRRAKKRNRPLWWKAGVFATKALAAFVGLYIGSALLLSLREPNIATDYLAKLNEPISSIPAKDRALPLYLKAWANPLFKDDHLSFLFNRTPEGYLNYARISPGHPDWAKAHDLLAANAETLEILRSAAAMPALGFEAKPRGYFSDAEVNAFDLKTWPGENLSKDPKAVPMIALLLPHLKYLRSSAGLIAVDMVEAAEQADAPRIIADYTAMRQMALHANECPILVSRLVAVGILAFADERLAEVNLAYPTLLAAHRVALLHRMSAPTNLYQLDLTGERMGMDDIIQRIYSDDGHGDGILTLQGISFMRYLSGPMSDIIPGEHPLHVAMLPAAAALMASRAELTTLSNHFYDLADSEARLPAWERRTKAQREKEAAAFKADPVKSTRYAPLTAMLHICSRAMDAMDTARAQHEALMVALALDVYRDKLGHYPATLAELVPQYLPAVPLDLSTGQPLRYKLVNDKPLLYGLGWDAKDDGGVWTDKKTSYPRIPETGDWVLYPPPAEN